MNKFEETKPPYPLSPLKIECLHFAFIVKIYFSLVKLQYSIYLLLLHFFQHMYESIGVAFPFPTWLTFAPFFTNNSVVFCNLLETAMWRGESIPFCELIAAPFSISLFKVASIFKSSVKKCLGIQNILIKRVYLFHYCLNKCCFLLYYWEYFVC